MSTLNEFDRSNLGDFLRSPLGERGTGTQPQVLTQLWCWRQIQQVTFARRYFREDEPLGSLVLQNVSADEDGQANYGMYKFVSDPAARRWRRRCIRRPRNDPGIALSMANPRSAIPISIIWRIRFYGYDVDFNSYLNVYAVNVHNSVFDVTNYVDFSKLLASVQCSTLIPNALNDISLDVPTFLANINSVTGCLLVTTKDDALQVDPGITNLKPSATFNITDNTLGGDEFIIFNY